MKLPRIDREGFVVISTVVLTLAGAALAVAQGAPYGSSHEHQTAQPSGQYSTLQTQVEAQHPNQQRYDTTQTNQANGTTNQHQGQSRYGQSVAAPARYPSTQRPPQYTAASMAFRDFSTGDEPTLNQPEEPVNQPSESVPSEPSQPSKTAPQPEQQDEEPSPEETYHFHSQPTPGFDGYSPEPYSPGVHRNYSTFDPGSSYAYGCYGAHGNVSCKTDACEIDCAPYTAQGRWFGGVYGLLMERAGSGYQPLAFRTTDRSAGYYFPGDSEVEITNNDLDTEYQGGAEIRFGSTLSWGSGNTYTPKWAWEVAYWGLAEESDRDSIFDPLPMTDDRIGALLDFRGLEVDFGDGFRPVNDFWGYENGVNLLRLPALVRNSQFGDRPRYEVTTSAGLRFIRFDEEFLARSEFTEFDGAVPPNPIENGTIASGIDVTNKLVGFQLGANGLYHLGSTGKWALYCDTKAGIYGNDIEVTRSMDGTDGAEFRYENGDQDEFNTSFSDTMAAISGELRTGMSYQYTPHCRLTAGWRVFGVTGVAVALDQQPSAFSTPAQTSGVNSEGSVFLHGLQTGVEWNY